MPRYEMNDSVSRKFFIVDIVDGTSVRTRHGRVGAEAKEKTTQFASAALAERAAARAVAARLKQGYAEVEAVRLEAPSATLRALEAKIAEDPGDLASCAVYGDWLQERNDPLGEVLALHVAIAGENDAGRRAALERELETARTSPRLFGPVAPHLDRLELTWQLGVLRHVRVRTGPPERGVSSAALLGLLFSLPVARFVSRLSFPAFALVDFGLDLPELTSTGGLRTIRALDIEAAGGPGASSRRKLQRLSALSGLRRLSLPFSRFDGAGLSLPCLETIALTDYFLSDTDVATLEQAELPHLTRVVVPFVSTGADLAGLASIATLRIVRVCGNSFGRVEETVRRLHASLPKVDTFELDDVDAATVTRLTQLWPELRVVARRAGDLD